MIAFCGEAAMHQLSWNAARQFHISKRGGLGGVDDTLFSLLLSRPKARSSRLQLGNCLILSYHFEICVWMLPWG